MPKEPTALRPTLWRRFSEQYRLATGLRVVAVANGGDTATPLESDPFLCPLRIEGGRKCSSFYRRAARQSFQSDEPLLFRCPGGLLTFGFRTARSKNGKNTFAVFGGVVLSDGPTPSRLSTLVQGMGGSREQTLKWVASLPDLSAQRLLEMGRLGELCLNATLRAEELQESFGRERTQVLTLFDVASDLHQAASSYELFALALNALSVLYDVPSAGILLLEPGEDALRAQVAIGALEETISSWRLPTSPDAQPLLGNLEGNPVLLDDPRAFRRLGLPETVDSVALFPLALGGNEDGVLALLNTSFSADDVQTIRGFCRQISLALENKKLEAGIREKASEVKAVRTLGRQFLLCREPERLFQAILEQARRITGAERGSLMICEEGGDELLIRAVSGINEKVVQKLRIRPGEGVAGRVFESGEPVLVENVEKDPRFQRRNRARHSTKSFVSLPIEVGDGTIGVLNLSDKSSGEVFAEEDLRKLEAVAVQATMAIERSTYYQQSVELRQISITDPLTGLLNRRYFQERLAEEVERASRHEHALSLIMVDIDHFKPYNDSNGHPAGDRALVQVAKALRTSVRTIDVVSRFGGEEFAVILPQTRKQEACEIAERIRSEVEALYIAGEEGLPNKRLTISLGVAAFPEDCHDLKSLVQRSDQALYRAKDEGRNRVVSLSPGGVLLQSLWGEGP